ncbi:hypothetical protein D1815_02350 [Aquimarina sp. AD1]|uniref:hypothetical protein n=1 Tax=Aquimarina TaxID=290174 RepID=UPI00040F1848|nr:MULTISPECIES: hypothetical protein [Aquimarina]AXT54648.1 hypothetical protein D1815_02350 [Aquimarina sp. AD1]RKN21715.1 hypothetical protein D7035_12490 [Aquimarina sp. AD1]
MNKKRLSVAANLGAPSYKMLLELGYEITIEGKTWIAESDDWILRSEGPIELLGLANIVEKKGENWKVTDSEIAEFLKKIE